MIFLEMTLTALSEVSSDTVLFLLHKGSSMLLLALASMWVLEHYSDQKVLRGDMEGAAEELLKYTIGGGKVLKGLVNRRNDERAMFLS
jgi:hypothetical protein